KIETKPQIQRIMISIQGKIEIMKVQTPPKVQSLSAIREKYPDREQEYFEYFSPVDKKGRYLHCDQLRFRVGDLDPSLVWSIVKFVRSRQQHFVLNLGEPPQACSFWLTPLIQKAISETDRNTTAASLDWMLSQIGEQSHFQYLLNDLTEDESISSSQLEGAATTTQVAKDLLKKERKPTTEGERMILGNYRMMLCAWENRNEKL